MVLEPGNEARVYVTFGVTEIVHSKVDHSKRFLVVKMSHVVPVPNTSQTHAAHREGPSP